MNLYSRARTGALNGLRRVTGRVRAATGRARPAPVKSAAPKRRVLIVAALYGVVAVPGILLSYLAATESTSKHLSSRGVNRLEFPADCSAGSLHALNTRFYRFRHLSPHEDLDNRWEFLADARGAVVAQPREMIWLELGGAAFERPLALSELHPDALFRISLKAGAPPLRDELAAQIARLSGLRELDLQHAGASLKDWTWIASFTRLEWLRLPDPEDPALRAQILARCARSGLEPAEHSEHDMLIFQRPLVPQKVRESPELH